MQKLFSLLLIFLCSTHTLRKRGDTMLVLHSLNKLIVLTLQLCHDLFGYLFYFSIIFALDVALFLIFIDLLFINCLLFYLSIVYLIFLLSTDQLSFIFFKSFQRGSVFSSSCFSSSMINFSNFFNTSLSHVLFPFLSNG